MLNIIRNNNHLSKVVPDWEKKAYDLSGAGEEYLFRISRALIWTVTFRLFAALHWKKYFFFLT